MVSQEPWKLLWIIIQRGSELDTAFHCEALRSGQGMQNETTLGRVGAKRATWFHVAKRRISSYLVVQARWDWGGYCRSIHDEIGTQWAIKKGGIIKADWVSFNQPNMAWEWVSFLNKIIYTVYKRYKRTEQCTLLNKLFSQVQCTVIFASLVASN